MTTRNLFAGAILLAAIAVPTHASSQIAVSKAVFIERTASADGWRTLAPADTLKRGDRVVLMIEWSGAQARKNHVVTSAIPATLAFQRSSANGLQVSADGGRNWGMLDTLRHDGRRASPEDITHVRLKLSGTRGGRITYSAIVR